MTSLALTVGLGAVLGLQLSSSMHQRSIDRLRQATQGDIAITTNMIATTNQGPSGAALTLGEERAQVRLMTSASQTLLRLNDSVGVDVALPNGMVIAGAGAAPPGTVLAIDPGFRAALAGATTTRILRRPDPAGASPVEEQLLGQHGDLLELQTGVRSTPEAPITVVVRTYAVMGPSQQQADTDVVAMLRLLAIGLLVFWAVLFRLVIGASRRLERESKASAHLATHDALTGLPNRVLFRDRVEQAIAATRRNGGHAAVLLLDLNRFKDVNDTLGHQYGDLLLQMIGPRLRQNLREVDTVARFGGDEFAVLLGNLTNPSHATLVAETLVLALQQAFEVNGVPVDVGCALGIALAPQHGNDFEQLLRRADIAMYAAKRESLEVVCYTDALEAETSPHLSLVSELRRAIDAPGQIVLHYQPKVDLASSDVTSVEALVRWHHPTRGLLGPDQFIPVAEATGVIGALTQHVLRLALAQNREWAEHGVLLRVAVNLSARCLPDTTLPSKVAQLLKETGVPAERLDIEITETAMMSNPGQAITVLRELAALGIRVSVDDFGTGYSSMAYLKHLPVSEIKIDRTFVTDMAWDNSDYAIVRSSIELARQLGLDVVAEGVEAADVLARLSELDCTTVQGYYFSKPLPPDELWRWLAAWPGNDRRPAQQTQSAF